jgi:hypothetical protein
MNEIDEMVSYCIPVYFTVGDAVGDDDDGDEEGPAMGADVGDELGAIDGLPVGVVEGNNVG